MPSPPERDLIAALIEELALRNQAPKFAPHVTLFAGEVERERALACLSAVDSDALELEVESIRCSDAFTKTVYLQLRQTAAALELSSTISDEIGDDGEYLFDPHLSLIYKALTAQQKAEIAANVSLPFEKVRFDRVRVIHGPAQTRTAEDVNAWTVLAERSLLQLS